MSCFRKFIRSTAGVTLVELVSAMGIASIVVGVPTVAFKASMDAADKGQVTSEMIGDTRLASEWLSRDIRNARTLKHLSQNRLDVELTEVRDISYFLNNGNLMRRVIDGGEESAKEMLLEGISSLDFIARDEFKPLVPDLSTFPDTGLSPADIDAARLVSFSSVISRKGNDFLLRSSARINVSDDVSGGTNNAVFNPTLSKSYNTLQEAINDPALTSGMTLRARAMTFKEDLVTSKSFKLEGGWNSDFSERPAGSFSILDGSLALQGGKVWIKWFKFI